MNDAAERLDLNVRARGFTLLRLKMQSRLSPLSLDVNSFSLETVPGAPTTQPREAPGRR